MEVVKTHNGKLIQWVNYMAVTSREISIKEDVLIFFDAALSKADGKASFGLVMKLKGVPDEGPKVFSSKEAKTGAILLPSQMLERKEVFKACVLSDAKEVVHAINDGFN